MPRALITKIIILLTISFSFVIGGHAFAKEKSAAFKSANVLMEKQEFKPAIKIIEKAQKDGEDNIDMSLLLTEALAGRVDQVGKLKQLKVAKKIKRSMEHSLTLDPNNLDAMEGLVQYHLQAPSIAGGDKKEAKIWIGKIIKLDPVRGHMLGARLAGGNKNYDEAYEHLGKAFEADENNHEVHLAVGVLDMEQELYEQANTAFEKCLMIKADNIHCLYLQGKAAQLGNVNLEKGKAAFEAIIKSNPEDKNYLAYSHYRLGEIYKQGGDKVAAKKQYELALKTDDIKPARKALKELK